MKIIKYKNQLIIAMHLLFWILSINAWNIVFNPGVESTSAIKGLQDYWLDLLLLNFVFYLYCLMPFIWLIKAVRQWLKISVTVLFLIPLCYLIYLYLQPEADSDDISLFKDFFLSGFMYAAFFHLTIAAAVYFNLYVLADKYLKMSRFGYYLLSVLTLTVVAAFANFALYDYGIDLIFPNLYFISYFKIWELCIIVATYLILTTVVFLVWQYTDMLIANRDKAQSELSELKAQLKRNFKQ